MTNRINPHGTNRRLHVYVRSQLNAFFEAEDRRVASSGDGRHSHMIVHLPYGAGDYAVDLNQVIQGTFDWPMQANAGGVPREDVYAAIDEERQYQDDKFGANREQSLAGFLVLIRNELNEADLGWAKDLTGRNSVMHEIRQIAAVCVSAMERYGTVGNATPTDDIPD